MRNEKRKDLHQGKLASANISPVGIGAENVGTRDASVSLPCNCYHAKKDHHIIKDDYGELYTWCVYSEYGQCPCDQFTELDNLEYIEYMAELKRSGYRGNSTEA